MKIFKPTLSKILVTLVINWPSYWMLFLYSQAYFMHFGASEQYDTVYVIIATLATYIFTCFIFLLLASKRFFTLTRWKLLLTTCFTLCFNVFYPFIFVSPLSIGCAGTGLFVNLPLIGMVNLPNIVTTELQCYTPLPIPPFLPLNVAVFWNIFLLVILISYLLSCGILFFITGRNKQ